MDILDYSMHYHELKKMKGLSEGIVGKEKSKLKTFWNVCYFRISNHPKKLNIKESTTPST
jgi:hypothetical protein